MSAAECLSASPSCPGTFFLLPLFTLSFSLLIPFCPLVGQKFSGGIFPSVWAVFTQCPTGNHLVGVLLGSVHRMTVRRRYHGRDGVFPTLVGQDTLPRRVRQPACHRPNSRNACRGQSRSRWTSSGHAPSCIPQRYSRTTMVARLTPSLTLHTFGEPSRRTWLSSIADGLPANATGSGTDSYIM